MKFLVADDHELILKGIEGTISDSFSNSEIQTVQSAEEAWAALKQNKYDFLISDISMKGMDGIELCRKVKKSFPEMNIIVITQHKKIWIIKQLYGLQVDGVLLKEDGIEELHNAINAISSGEKYYTRSINEIILNYMVHKTQADITNIELTEREKEVLELIAQEYTTKEIADRLFVSLKTIETHRKNLLIKFDVKNMVGLVKKAMELGLLD